MSVCVCVGCVSAKITSSCRRCATRKRRSRSNLPPVTSPGCDSIRGRPVSPEPPALASRCGSPRHTIPVNSGTTAKSHCSTNIPSLDDQAKNLHAKCHFAMHGQKKTLSIFLVPGFSISSAVALMSLLLVVVVIIVYLMHLSCGFDEALFSFFLSFSFYRRYLRA